MTDVRAPYQVWDLVSQAALDEELRARAAAICAKWPVLMEHASHERAGKAVRVSDAGRCVRELWSELHDKLDIPESAETVVTRFDIGTAYGAWIAALFAAALEVREPTWRCFLEDETRDGDGITGHIDVLVTDADHTTIWLIEIKSSYWTKALDPAKRFQVLQGGKYAVETMAPIFTVFTIGPAVQATYDRKTRTRTEVPKQRQDDFDTAEWAQDVADEYARLRGAVADEAPEGDPDEDWRCRFCRASWCEDNRNPANPRIAEYAETGV